MIVSKYVLDPAVSLALGLVVGITLETLDQTGPTRAQAELAVPLSADPSHRPVTLKGLTEKLVLEHECASGLEAIPDPPLDPGSGPETRWRSRSKVEGGRGACAGL